ncbi:MAG TPA: ATPase, partial [Thermotogae bacterium]|nr:ATPase [Thermotogota bacterium]
MFIDREKELGELNKFYDEDRFQFVVVYGRRRVGKTFLLLEFCKDKPCIFFTAKETSERDMLEGFSQSVFSFFGLKGLTSFDSWEKAFQFLAGRARNERLVVVLDEFPYMVNSSKSLPSTLQKLIDHELSNTRLFLIVCGSSMSFMEKEILSYKSPLYGRRTGQLLVEPFDFFNARKFFPKYSFDEQVVVYGVLGGIPQYLKAFDQEKDVYENIRSQILSKTSFLYEEPMFLLRQEL